MFSFNNFMFIYIFRFYYVVTKVFKKTIKKEIGCNLNDTAFI